MTDLPNCYRCHESPCTCADGATLLQGDCKTVMESLPEKHFQVCVTSPPYFALRSYLPADHPDKPLEIGSETSIEAFVATMVEVFRGVWRVLRDDGVLFVNLGDSYAATGKNRTPEQAIANTTLRGGTQTQCQSLVQPSKIVSGLKPKDLCGIPWRVALALQADGWYLRDAIVWKKPSPMPGSQRDRCTSSYEFIFQLTKRPRYFFDIVAVREPSKTASLGSVSRPDYDDRKWTDCTDGSPGCRPPMTMNNREYNPAGRIPRNVLTMASEGYSAAHFATFPRALPEWCIKAATSEKGCCPECGSPWVRVTDSERVATRPGKNTKIAMPSGWARGDESHDTVKLNTPEGMERRLAEEIGNRDPGRHVTSTRTIGWEPGCKCYGWTEGTDPRDGSKRQVIAKSIAMDPIPCRVLDPFAGAGTTGLAAIGLQRHCTLIELAEDYCDQIVKRLRDGLYAKTQKREDLPGQQSLFTDN